MQERETRKVLDNLRDDREPIENSALHHLSNLTREEQKWLKEAWPSIVVDKRRLLVERLGEKAEKDIQLDFTAVFRQGLSDADSKVRQLSIDGLWENESVSLIRPFLALLREDKSNEVRASAATAMGRFVLQGELGYLTEERGQEMVDALVNVVNQTSLPIFVRRRAVESLAYSSDDRVRGIIERAYQDQSVEMQASAIFAMGRSADEYWRGTVRMELLTTNPALRFEAARAAGELTDKHAVKRLILLLDDLDPEVRKVAAWSLGQIGGREAKRALERVVQGDNAILRRVARESLAEMSLLDESANSLFVDPDLDPSLEETVLEDETDLDAYEVLWDEEDALNGREDEP